MNVEKLLPIAAPTPAGVVIGIRLYQEIINAIGTSNPFWQFIAGGAAFVGCVAMIGAEMYAYKQAALALAEREVKAAVLAFLLALVCSGLIVMSVYTSENSRPLIGAVVVAIVAYAISAIRDYLTRKNEKRTISTSRADEERRRLDEERKAQTEHEREMERLKMEHEREIEKMRTAQAQAKAREAKAEHGFLNVRAVREQREQTNSRALGSEKIQAIRDYQKSHPSATVREVAEAVGVSNASVQKYGGAQ